ncbi:MAG: type II secretion system major pseudopilin GspG [Planctomycetaceae bacterium]|nr:type II secretion system major pseudopilin GspG [Planctomycetaceae bacterium]
MLTRNRCLPGHRRRRGFTLMEVLLVLAILGVIMSLVVPKLLGRQKHAHVDATYISIHGVEQALKLYSLDHGGSLPSSSDGLNALLRPGGSSDRRWRGPYVEELPRDAWGNEIAYQFPGRKNPDGADVFSPGPDGVAGTEDDVGNWREL